MSISFTSGSNSFRKFKFCALMSKRKKDRNNGLTNMPLDRPILGQNPIFNHAPKEGIRLAKSCCTLLPSIDRLNL